MAQIIRVVAPRAAAFCFPCMTRHGTWFSGWPVSVGRSAVGPSPASLLGNLTLLVREVPLRARDVLRVRRRP